MYMNVNEKQQLIFLKLTERIMLEAGTVGVVLNWDDLSRLLIVEGCEPSTQGEFRVGPLLF